MGPNQNPWGTRLQVLEQKHSMSPLSTFFTGTDCSIKGYHTHQPFRQTTPHENGWVQVQSQLGTNGPEGCDFSNGPWVVHVSNFVLKKTILNSANLFDFSCYYAKFGGWKNASLPSCGTMEGIVRSAEVSIHYYETVMWKPCLNWYIRWSKCNAMSHRSAFLAKMRGTAHLRWMVNWYTFRLVM